MTLSPTRTSRFGIFAAAILYSGLTIGAATAPVAAEAKEGPYYTVELAAPTAETRAIAGGVAWACKDDKCVANKASTRPINVCRDLARDLGEIKSFTAKGKKLEAAKLAKCNGK